MSQQRADICLLLVCIIFKLRTTSRFESPEVQEPFSWQGTNNYHTLSMLHSIILLFLSEGPELHLIKWGHSILTTT